MITTDRTQLPADQEHYCCYANRMLLAHTKVEKLWPDEDGIVYVGPEKIAIPESIVVCYLTRDMAERVTESIAGALARQSQMVQQMQDDCFSMFVMSWQSQDIVAHANDIEDDTSDFEKWLEGEVDGITHNIHSDVFALAVELVDEILTPGIEKEIGTVGMFQRVPGTEDSQLVIDETMRDCIDTVLIGMATRITRNPWKISAVARGFRYTPTDWVLKVALVAPELDGSDDTTLYQLFTFRYSAATGFKIEEEKINTINDFPQYILDPIDVAEGRADITLKRF